MIDNVVITLFGGLAAVLVLYALGGLVRGVPPLVRAIVAGGVPLVAYFALILGHWPGLDVVAIHISVYFATALVLLALTQFRKRGGRMHWAPKLLMLFFLGLTVLMAGFLNIATNGLPEPIARWWLGSDRGPVFTAFSGVVPHGQGAATTVSSELSKSHREEMLGWQVEFSGLEAGGKTRPIKVRVTDRTGLAVEDIEVHMALSRPGAAVPVSMEPLSLVEAGVYQGALTLPAPGRWMVEVRLSRRGVVMHRTTRELVVS